MYCILITRYILLLYDVNYVNYNNIPIRNWRVDYIKLYYIILND